MPELAHVNGSICIKMHTHNYIVLEDEIFDSSQQYTQKGKASTQCAKKLYEKRKNKEIICLLFWLSTLCQCSHCRLQKTLTCKCALEELLLITAARNSRTLSRVSDFFRRQSKTSCKPSYKPFITVFMVVNDDSRSAGRRVDASEKHC